MQVSLIIPTYNGANKLPNILKSIEAQNEQPDQVLIVVDGSTDNSLSILEEYKSRLKQLNVVYQENCGRAAVRNKGASMAKGDVFVFFDDDMRLLPDTIEKHKAFHQVHSDAILVGRAALDPTRIENDFARFRLKIEDSWRQGFKDKLSKVSLKKYAFTTQNLSCSKKTFELLDGFDERLRDSEDFDFSMKALQLNIPIYYDYNLVAWHDDYIDMDKYIKRQTEYVLSKLRLLKLKPDLVDLHPQSFKYGIQRQSIFSKIARHFFSNTFSSKFLNSKLFSKIVPQNIRYKLYDLVITITVESRVNKLLLHERTS